VQPGVIPASVSEVYWQAAVLRVVGSLCSHYLPMLSFKDYFGMLLVLCGRLMSHVCCNICATAQLATEI